MYARDRAPELHTDAKTLKGFITKLGAWWALKTISEVKRSSCKEYVAWRTDQAHASFTKNKTDRKVSDQTARRELEVLSAAIGYWDDEHKLSTRPDVWLPPKPESNRDALTRSQGAALLWAAIGHKRVQAAGDDASAKWTGTTPQVRAQRRHLRRFILIGFYTGTRSKVIRSLLWEESALQAWVDLDRGMIYRRGKAEKDRPNKRRPVVRIPARLLAHMRRWRAIDLKTEERRRLGDKVKRIKADPHFRLVSVMHFGGVPIVGPARTGFASCVADAGLPEEITPHWMRHTCATWLMEGGAESWDASGYTGMSTTMLENNYGHHRPDYQDAARRAAGGRKPALKLVSRE